MMAWICSRRNRLTGMDGTGDSAEHHRQRELHGLIGANVSRAAAAIRPSPRIDVVVQRRDTNHQRDASYDHHAHAEAAQRGASWVEHDVARTGYVDREGAAVRRVRRDDGVVPLRELQRAGLGTHAGRPLDARPLDAQRARRLRAEDGDGFRSWDRRRRTRLRAGHRSCGGLCGRRLRRFSPGVARLN